MISVVICSVNPQRFAAITEQYRRLIGDEPHEIIGIHDARGICEGYNRGFAKSRGEIVIFCHDDIEMLVPDFIARVKRHIASYDLVGVAGTDKLVGPGWIMAGPPHIFGQVVHTQKEGLVVCIYGAPRPVVDGIQAMDGLFLAFRRSAVEKLGGWDDRTFTAWHCYDIDMVFRAHLAGMKIAVACDLPILHHSGGDFGGSWQDAAKVFMTRHGDKLQQGAPRWHQFGGVLAASREEAVAAMTPRYWRDGQ